MISRGTAALTAAVLLGASSIALAEGPQLPAPPMMAERTVDALKVFPMLDRFLAVPRAQRSMLALGYQVMKGGKPSPDVHLTLIVGDRKTLLPIAPDGRLMRMPSEADIAAHAQIEVSAPKGSKLSMQLDLGTAIVPAAEISAADCALAITQANGAIKQAAGMIGGFLAPHVSRVTFPDAKAGVVVAADGKTTPLPLVKGVPAYDPGKFKNAKLLRLERAPSRVQFD